jgi:hypothetical protein
LLEQELTRMRAEQRNLAGAVATGGDSIPELVGELRKRNTRIKQLEDDVEAAKRSPQMAAELLATEEANIRAQAAGFRETLNQRGEDTREVLQSLYPAGFRFVEKKKGTRLIWSIHGMAELGGLVHVDGEGGHGLPARLRDRRRAPRGRLRALAHRPRRRHAPERPLPLTAIRDQGF